MCLGLLLLPCEPGPRLLICAGRSLTDDVWGFLASAAAVLQFGSMAQLHPQAQVEMRQLRLSLSVSETGSGGHAHIPPEVVKESQAEAGATSGLKWSGCFRGPQQPQDPGWKSL